MMIFAIDSICRGDLAMSKSATLILTSILRFGEKCVAEVLATIANVTVARRPCEKCKACEQGFVICPYASL